MFQFNNNLLCSIPAFFYPTTVILVDDQPEFTSTTALALAHDYKTLSFNDSKKAIAYFSQNIVFQGICHGVASTLSHDTHENTSFLFDGNFLPLLRPFRTLDDIFPN